MDEKMFALVNAKFYGQVADKESADLGVVIKDDRIVDVCHESKISSSIPRVDMQGCKVMPGFIDLLTNGAGGGAFGVSADYDDLQLMANTMLAEGTTGFLAAAPSNTQELYLKMQNQLAEHQDNLPANFLGLHLEGPYLSKEFRGAHREECVRQCADSELHELLDKDPHFITLMTVAPECINAQQIAYLKEKGVKISFGHSAVDYDTALQFFENTGCCVTHLYNGMPSMHHRNPGQVPAIFQAKPLTGVIVDGEHVAYPMVQMAHQLMGDELYLFTDRFTECPAMGVSHDGEHDYFVRTTPAGKQVMCGSALTMLKAVRNCVELLGMPMYEAVSLSSYNPARALGIDKEVGILEPGYLANLVAINDDWQVQRTMIAGKWVYERS